MFLNLRYEVGGGFFLGGGLQKKFVVLNVGCRTAGYVHGRDLYFKSFFFAHQMLLAR